MTMQEKGKLLLIDDDKGITTALSQALSNSYDIDIAHTGKAGIYKTDQETYAAIVLDLNLPDIPGLSVCQQLRERGVSAPLLILSGETQVLTKINLLDAGANDYLTKPFSLGEFKARIRALSRHSDRSSPAVSKMEVSDLMLNTITREVLRRETPISLRRKEFAMLECLMMNAGMVVSRRALTRYAWNGEEDIWTNTIDVHIKHLRDKVDKPFEDSLIKTVHGIGYKIEAPPVREMRPCVT